MLSASLQSAVRGGEDGEQCVGLADRFSLILRRFGQERALADEDLYRQAASLAQEHTPEVAQRPERSDENNFLREFLFVVHVRNVASICA